MAATNHERIGQGLAILATAVEPWMVKALEAAYGQNWWDRVDQEAVEKTGKGVGTNYSDPYFQLSVMIHHWGPVFGKTLGKAERNYAGELLEVRNRWAHPKADQPFTSSDTERALDTMARLATSISAPDQAKKLTAMRGAILRAAWEAAQKLEAKQQATLPLEGAVAPGLRPWRDVVEPHPDVAAGRYAQAEFAADLGQVARGEAGEEYGNPRRFFERTFLTAGLSDLLVTGLRRLAGQPEGDPVVELQTNFGGGKTHSMLALYHLVSGEAASALPGVEPILAKAGVGGLPAVRRAVVVGTALSPGQPRRIDGIDIRTLWGELAWQLGGAAGYGLLAEADAHGVSPGSDVLRDLFVKHGPALILIDEWVTYVRQLWTDQTLPAGSFDANITFAQALTEAVKASDRTLLVASLPSSDIEKGGEGGQVATERLKHVVGRVQSPWRPASPEEGFEIVRRRLFTNIPADKLPARDAAVQAFADMYAKHTGDFPSESKEASYQRRMLACYPIHPELFDQLFGAWSTLEKFQQTRGVLRLMAAVIHELWESNDQSPLIIPATIPIHEGRVQSELTRYLEEQWVPVIERDVDGEHSLPLALDRENPATLGRLSAARRVARAIYMGSAPTANAATRGIDDRRIKLGSVFPGEPVATFGDALRRLSDRSTYLYDNAGRYWFSTQPSVNRLAADRAAQQRDDDVLEEIRRRLRLEQVDRGLFARVHPAPLSASDVPDDDEVALVILGPEVTHSGKTDVSSGRDAARTILDERGTGARRHRNMLVFLAADTDKVGALVDAVRTHLAWKSVDEDKTNLTLDAFQVNQIATKRKEADDTVSARIPEAYQWLLVPTQPDPLGAVELAPTRLTGSGSLAARAGTKLKADGGMVVKFGSVTLRLELDRHPDIWSSGDVDLKYLWDLFSTYVYLPRLRDVSVLTEAVRDGASGFAWRDTFAYASGKADDGRYLGLVMGGRQFEPLVDGSARIVKPDVAEAQPVPESGGTVYPKLPDHGGGHSGAGEGSTTATESPAVPEDPRVYVGSVGIDATRPGPKFGQLATEVIAHLAALDGTDVTISVEIKAKRPAGFPSDVVRIVNENAAQLKFDSGSGFEDD
jgi:predicted AAA+ superfamily ATPase